MIAAEPAQGWEQRYGIRHIAIFGDGNRRWAEERGLGAAEGHAVGLMKTLPALLGALSEAGVHTQTYFGFASQNWKREGTELEYMLDLFASFAEHKILALANRHDARLVGLGTLDRVPPALARILNSLTERTRGNGRHVWNFALDYSGEEEIDRATQRMIEAAARGADPRTLRVRDFLDTADQPYPNPDLIIRPGGEQRLSGFMPIQSAYSEFFPSDVLWPDFTFAHAEEIARAFAQRRKRFGT